MADKNNMLFYASWYDIIQECVESESEKYFIIDSLLRYGLKGEKIDTDNPAFVMFQKQAFVQIDSAKEKHEKRVAAGRKGGSTTGQSKARKGNQNAKRKQTQANDNVNDNDNENIINIINNVNRLTASPLSFEGQGSQLSIEELAELSHKEET